MSTEPARKKQKTQKAKVSKACVFCRRSHMSCDDKRPCTRCVKREIAHLCTDDNPKERSMRNTPDNEGSAQPEASTSASSQPQPMPESTPSESVPSSAPQLSESSLYAERQPTTSSGNSNSYYSMFYSNPSAPAAVATDPFTEFFNSAFQHQSPQMNQEGNNALGNETYGPGLSDFLKSLDEPGLFSPPHSGIDASGISPSFALPGLPHPSDPNFGALHHPSSAPQDAQVQQPQQPQQGNSGSNNNSDMMRPSTSTSEPSNGHQMSTNEDHLNLRPSNQNDRYLLAAADQRDGSRDERLARVIHAKFEAGLLKPYDYVAGYRRLFRWMESHMSQTSRKRTLQTISQFRPSFRAIASSLTDLDLILIEEAFERLLLDYDRVFSTMGIPACLWRRTGEIYKGNKEFADLVGVSIDSLRDGKLAIYELMGEESAANYWEKYGSIAFNSGQKAVLTSCVLVQQDKLVKHSSKTPNSSRSQQDPQTVVPREVCLNCTFSFTVRRDSANIPYAIAGNFLPF